MSAKGYTSQRFAEIMNVQPSGISHILAGRNKPRFDFLVRLLERFPDVSPDWLLLGNGPMFRETELKGRDTLSSIMSSQSADNTASFKVDSLFAGSYAPGDTVDMNDNYHTFELYEDPKIVDLDYFDDESVIFDDDNDFRHEPTPQGPANLAMPSPSADSSTTLDKPAQTVDIPTVTDSEKTVAEPPAKASRTPESPTVDTPEESVSPSSEITPDTNVASEEDKEETMITNVIRTSKKEAKVVKVILLYDNGKFEYYDK